MRTGNVIRDPSGSLWIVTNVRGGAIPTIEAVSFEHENVSAVQRFYDHDREETCCDDTDCPNCHGSGRYTKHVIGWSHSKVLAPCVKAFILDRVKKTWEI